MSISASRLGLFSIFALAASIPFTTRLLLYHVTPGFHEYEALFLYGSDLVLLLFLGVSLVRGLLTRGFLLLSRGEAAALAVLLLASLVAGLNAVSTSLALYGSIRLVLLVLCALSVAGAVQTERRALWLVLAGLSFAGLFQSGVAILQFTEQSSLGLGLFGESPLDIFDSGTSRFFVGSARVLRGYGTLPHPNVLAAFLVASLFALTVLWFRESRARIRTYALTPMFFMLLLGTAVTFSRSLWLSGAVAGAALAVQLLAKSATRARAALLVFIVGVSIASITLILNPFIRPRLGVLPSAPAVSDRASYNTIGRTLVRAHPFGVGMGNQVLTAVREDSYKEAGISEPSQWQPVHNLYLLAGSEVGLIGAGALIIFFLSVLMKITNSSARGGSAFGGKIQITNKSQNPPPEADPPSAENSKLPETSHVQVAVFKSLLIALLVSGLFDHFLWTLWPGSLLLWLSVGLVLGMRGSRHVDGM